MVNSLTIKTIKVIVQYSNSIILLTWFTSVYHKLLLIQLPLIMGYFAIVILARY